VRILPVRTFERRHKQRNAKHLYRPLEDAQPPPNSERVAHLRENTAILQGGQKRLVLAILLFELGNKRTVQGSAVRHPQGSFK
jgi:hypothetical protein